MLKNILLAEDEPSTALLVKKQLERAGFNISVANNGREALKIIAQQDIDLLITDVVMPEMDGVDLYLALKNNPLTAQIPIIIVTDKEMFKESFSALGVDHFVPKTSNINILIEKIHEVSQISSPAKNYRKILVGGSDPDTVKQIKTILQKNGYLVTTADNSMDLASKVFLMTPHAIFLDILMTEKASASELIQSFRSLNLFKTTAIVTYLHLSSDQINLDSSSLAFIEDEVAACKKAGVTKYIGRFSPLTFQDALQQLNIHSDQHTLTPDCAIALP